MLRSFHSVIRPKSGDERCHESAKATGGALEAGGEIAPRTAGGAESQEGDGEDDRDFSPL